MFKMTMMRRWQLAAAATLLAAAGAAQAQWMWVDASGKKQVSDRPPPASVPAKDILKSPMRAMVQGAPAAADGGEQMPPSANAAAGPEAQGKPSSASWTEREAEYRKRKAEKEVADKKAADEAATAGRQASACKKAQDHKTLLESGVRVRNGPGKGEFMSDEERAQSVSVAQRLITELCK